MEDGGILHQRIKRDVKKSGLPKDRKNALFEKVYQTVDKLVLPQQKFKFSYFLNKQMDCKNDYFYSPFLYLIILDNSEARYSLGVVPQTLKNIRLNVL